MNGIMKSFLFLLFGLSIMLIGGCNGATNRALDVVSKEYSVDQDCVTLTGLSTGGYGTYVIGAKYADRFAALVPMGSNGSDKSVVPKLTRMAVRAYCSESGDIFAGSNDEDM